MAYTFTRKTDLIDDVMAADVNELQAALEAHEFLTAKAATELTLDTGEITVTQSVHKLQPESGTADDLDTINGMDEGDILVLYASDSGTDTITLKHGTGNLSCVGASDIEMSHGAVICYYDGTTVYVSGGGGGGGGASAPTYLCQGRLTLESGVPVSTAGQANKTTLYFTPYNGNFIDIYNGTDAWVRHTFTQRELAVGGFTASKPYDIFIYDNAGTLTLSGEVWTDATTRATALATQDGIYVKTGATGYRYLGTIYIDSGQKCQDADNKRLVWNYYNRTLRHLYKSDSTSHTYATPTYRYWNNDATNKIELVTGLPIPLSFMINGRVVPGAATISQIGCAINSLSPTAYFGHANNGVIINAGVTNMGLLSEGYNYIPAVEYSSTSNTATFAFMYLYGITEM